MGVLSFRIPAKVAANKEKEVNVKVSISSAMQVLWSFSGTRPSIRWESFKGGAEDK